MSRGWQSYDAAAATHDQLAVPSAFARPARELVAHIGIPADAAVLDVGAGTGVAALAAAKSARFVVALDPALEMLRVARGHDLARVVVGAAPGLPFGTGAFDRVLASFVITHVASYRDAMADMARVLKPGGRLGVTAWGAASNEFRTLWRSLAQSFVGERRFAAAIEEALPWEDWFTDPGRLVDAFKEARLINIDVRRAEFTTRQTIAEFLALREASLEGRFLHQAVGEERWKEFKTAAAEQFHAAFRDPIEYLRDFHTAVGQVP